VRDKDLELWHGSHLNQCCKLSASIKLISEQILETAVGGRFEF
jgi:hypothetical protein